MAKSKSPSYITLGSRDDSHHVPTFVHQCLILSPGSNNEASPFANLNPGSCTPLYSIDRDCTKSKSKCYRFEHDTLDIIKPGI